MAGSITIAQLLACIRIHQHTNCMAYWTPTRVRLLTGIHALAWSCARNATHSNRETSAHEHSCTVAHDNKYTSRHTIGITPFHYLVHGGFTDGFEDVLAQLHHVSQESTKLAIIQRRPGEARQEETAKAA